MNIYGSRNKSNSSSSSSSLEGDKDGLNQKIKLIVVGDSLDGLKREFLKKYVQKDDIGPGFDGKDDIGPGFDGYEHKHILSSEDVIGVYLHDTYGREDYDKLRPLQYPHTDVVIFLYSVSNPASWENIKDRWSPEIKHYCPDALSILVASGIEIGNDPTAITFQQGAELAQEIGAARFFECSVATGELVGKLLHTTIELGIERLPFIPLIKELRQYAKDRKAEGEGYRWAWGDLLGGKPGAIKVKVANDLADDLDTNGIKLKRKFSQYELATLLEGDLGTKISKYSAVVAALEEMRAEPVAESGDNIQAVTRRPSF